MTDYFIEAELAKTGRSTCRGCKTIIEKGHLRIADSFYYDHFQSHPWHHIECFKKLSKRHANLNPEDIRGFSELDVENRKTVRSIIEDIKSGIIVKTKASKVPTKSRYKSKDTSSDEEKRAKTKDKKQKKTKKAKNPEWYGYTNKYMKLFKEYCYNYGSMTVYQLKAILSLNNQMKTGNKTDLVYRCADGKILGRIPTCTYCGGGKLRFNRINGWYSCPGYMDDNDFRRCGRYFPRKDITCAEWKYS